MHLNVNYLQGLVSKIEGPSGAHVPSEGVIHCSVTGLVLPSRLVSQEKLRFWIFKGQLFIFSILPTS